MLGVEISGEPLPEAPLEILQNGVQLLRDEAGDEDHWLLRDAGGELVLRWAEGTGFKENTVVLGDEGYVLFKLTGSNLRQGRRVKCASLGYYMVVAPEDWVRDDLSGRPPALPEPVSLARHKAHFFNLENTGDGKIALRAPDGTLALVGSKASRFELVGERLHDATENIGPLFGERPPRIRILGDGLGGTVKTVVVGQEGSGRRRWRKAFPAAPESEQDLPPEVATRRGGWFFVRFYDSGDELIESLDFRFLSSLRDIMVAEHCALPCPGGHESVEVTFVHDPGFSIRPAGSAEHAIRRHGTQTTVTVPAAPEHDQTHWLVKSEGSPELPVTILVERIWFAVAGEDQAPSQWTDRILTLPREHFAATSRSSLWVRFPRHPWTDRIGAGFQSPKARSYEVKVSEDRVAIPLREFGDCEELGDADRDHPFKLWCKEGENLTEITVAIVPAELRRTCGPGPDFSKIPAPPLARTLTQLQRLVRGPLRVLIKEVRRTYPGSRRASRQRTLGFVKRSLCLIALVSEVQGERLAGPRGTHRITHRWRPGVKDQLPEVFAELRDRYEQLKAGRIRRWKRIA